MTAPERIWVDNARTTADGLVGVWGERPHEKGGTEYVRANLIAPMIAAAVAARLEEAAGDLHSPKLIPHDDCWANAQAAIRALITSDEADALAEVRRQARVEGMREAMEALMPAPNTKNGLWAQRLAKARERIAALIAREGGE